MDHWSWVIEKARSGRQEAVHKLFDLIRPEVRKVVRCLSPWQTEDAVEEIVQESLIRILRSLHQFDTQKPFPPWWKQVVRHQLIDHIRMNGKVHGPLSIDTIPEAVDHRSVADQVAGTLDAKRLQVCLDRYKDVAARRIFDLYYLEDWSLETIGQDLGLEKSQVKGRLHRFRELLQECLQGGGVQR